MKHETSHAAEAGRGEPGVGRMLLDCVRARRQHVTLQPGRGRTAAGWLDERLDDVIFRGRLFRLAVQPTRNIPMGVIMSLEPADHDEDWLSGPDRVMDAIARAREQASAHRITSRSAASSPRASTTGGSDD